jgi:predicted nuclease of predicted toxin-antitoxin system
MQFKIDENLHPDVAGLLQRAGHDALTLWDQKMRGQGDDRVAQVCRAERRALVTLDLDFCDIRVYPPQDYCGLIVLRVFNQSRRHVLKVCERILSLLETEPLVGKLWVVDERGVRVRGGD